MDEEISWADVSFFPLIIKILVGIMKEDGCQKGLTSSLPWWFSLLPVSEMSNIDHSAT